jgi:hypothetical protein
MIDNKQLMEFLKNGSILDGYIDDDDSQYTRADINVNSNFRVSFNSCIYRGQGIKVRTFKIARKTQNNDFDVFYKGMIPEENYIEYDYLLTSRVQKFIEDQINSMLSLDELTF